MSKSDFLVATINTMHVVYVLEEAGVHMISARTRRNAECKTLIQIDESDRHKHLSANPTDVLAYMASMGFWGHIGTEVPVYARRVYVVIDGIQAAIYGLVPCAPESDPTTTTPEEINHGH